MLSIRRLQPQLQAQSHLTVGDPSAQPHSAVLHAKLSLDWQHNVACHGIRAPTEVLDVWPHGCLFHRLENGFPPPRPRANKPRWGKVVVHRDRAQRHARRRRVVCKCGFGEHLHLASISTCQLLAGCPEVFIGTNREANLAAQERHHGVTIQKADDLLVRLDQLPLSSEGEDAT